MNLFVFNRTVVCMRERVKFRLCGLNFILYDESMTPHDSHSVLPSFDEMREAVNEYFGFIPCTGQLEATLTQLRRRDLVTLASTESGNSRCLPRSCIQITPSRRTRAPHARARLVVVWMAIVGATARGASRCRRRASSMRRAWIGTFARGTSSRRLLCRSRGRVVSLQSTARVARAGAGYFRRHPLRNPGLFWTKYSCALTSSCTASGV